MRSKIPRIFSLWGFKYVCSSMGDQIRVLYTVMEEYSLREGTEPPWMQVSVFDAGASTSHIFRYWKTSFDISHARWRGYGHFSLYYRLGGFVTMASCCGIRTAELAINQLLSLPSSLSSSASSSGAAPALNHQSIIINSCLQSAWPNLSPLKCK